MFHGNLRHTDVSHLLDRWCSWAQRCRIPGFGFHSASAIAALVLLSCGPIQLNLPHEKHSNPALPQVQ